MIVAIGLCACSCTTFDGLSAAKPVEAGTPEPTFPAYLSLEDAARVCSLSVACDLLPPSITTSTAVPIDTLNYSLCLHWLAGPLPPNRIGVKMQGEALACVAKGKTCEAAAGCLAVERMSPGDNRCAIPDAGTSGDAATPFEWERCADDGGTVLKCAGNYALHCKSAYYGPGAKCLKSDDNTYWCGTAANCNSPSSCIGSLLEYCAGGIRESVNCSFLGYTCGISAVTDVANYPECLSGDRVNECNAIGSACAGNIAQVCDGFAKSDYDCASLGGTCSTKDGSARCVQPDEQCTPSDAASNVCNGNTIAVCVGGKRRSVDCAAIGLTCKPGSGARSAYCG